MNEDINNSAAVVDNDDWDDVIVGENDENEPDENGETEAASGEQANQAEAEGAEKPGDDPDASGEKPEADHSFKLNYMGEEKTVTRDEAVVLAQKGMDYDRIRQKYEERTEKDKANAEAFDFVSEMAKAQGMSVSEFTDNAKAALIAKRDGVDMSVAFEKAKLERREREIAEKERGITQADAAKRAEAEYAERRKRESEEFLREYPGVEPAKIPKEVWADVNKGMSLLAAYTKHENAVLKAEIEAERKNKENAQKAAPSADSAGAADKKDPDFDGWDDD